MLRTYIKPQMRVVNISTEGIIAASKPQVGVQQGSDQKIEGESEFLGNKYNSPWNSSNWENN